MCKSKDGIWCPSRNLCLLDDAGSDCPSDICQNKCDGSFLCREDRLCISQDLVCDHHQDCQDGSDESLHLCLEKCNGSFLCQKERVCISQDRVCDLQYDCQDGSDEDVHICDTLCKSSQYELCLKDCSNSATDNEPPKGHLSACAENCRNLYYGLFKCRTGSQCIGRTAVCNGVRDCEDNSDEGEHCKEVCKSNDGVWCPSGNLCLLDNAGNDEASKFCQKCNGSLLCLEERLCISQDDVCNQQQDCQDGSDESLDSSLALCNYSPYEPCLMQCIFTAADYGLPKGQLTDCTDNCRNQYYAPFKCRTGSQCLGRSRVCNGVPDCEDNSDEGEHCKEVCRAKDGAWCPYGNICFHSNAGSDEASNLCQKCSGSFLCQKEKLCILYDYVCNNQQDCQDGSDESPEVCHDKCKEEDMFVCMPEKKCIPQSSLCDMHHDCIDQSDESGPTCLEALRELERYSQD